MALLSLFKHSDESAASPLNIVIDAPESIHPNQGILPVGITVINSAEETKISNVYLQLIEQYDVHQEDFQQVADNFHEVKAEAVEAEPFTLAPNENRILTFQLELSGLRQKSAEIIQDNDTAGQPVTKILRTGAVRANVLRLGDNKENVHYTLKVTAEANGKLVSPPTQHISLRAN